MTTPLEQDQLDAIALRIGKLLKTSPRNDAPAYSPVYKETVTLADSVAVHAEYGKFPERLLRDKAPNEDPEEFRYRKAIYKQRTLPYWNRALSTINRVWNEQNYFIEWKEDADIHKDNPAKEFFMNSFPEYKDVRSYFRSVVTPYKIKDPNAVLVVMPKELPLVPALDEEGNPILTLDDTALLEPQAAIYPCSRVAEFDEGNYALILSYEKSTVRYGGKDIPEGLVYYLIDTANIYRMVQYGTKNEFTFRFELFYPHSLGYLPAQLLKGKPVSKEEYEYYHSYFMDAVPYLDIATCNGSTLDMSVYAHAFPERWEFVEECPGEHGFPCLEGYIGDGEHRHRCTTCRGLGRIYKHSPLGVFEMRLGDKFNQGDRNLPVPPFGYVAPNQQILEFLKTTIDNDIISAFAFLNIDLSNSNANGKKETALGKRIDREELFSFMLNISNELFDLLRFTIKACGEMRYGPHFQAPVVKAPTDFAIRSENDLSNEIAMAKTNNLPDIAVRKMLKSFLQARFNTAQDIDRLVDVVLAVDRIATMSNADINDNITSGRVQLWEAILHDSISSLLEERLALNPAYLEQDLGVIKAELIGMSKGMVGKIADDF